MRIRVVFNPHKYWYVESKKWYQLRWHWEASFHSDDAYERAHFFCTGVKEPAH